MAGCSSVASARLGTVVVLWSGGISVILGGELRPLASPSHLCVLTIVRRTPSPQLARGLGSCQERVELRETWRFPGIPAS